jgi:membrane protease subunit (stomatin/prohibitin family)
MMKNIRGAMEEEKKYIADRLSNVNTSLVDRLAPYGYTDLTVYYSDKREHLFNEWKPEVYRIDGKYLATKMEKAIVDGQYGIYIADSAMFVKKLIGTLANFTAEDVEDQLRIDVVETVKVSISKYMKENNVNINELGTSYRELARTIVKDLKITFEEYGVELLNFNVEDISFDERDKGYQTVMEGIAEQARLSKLGISYMQQKQLDIAQTAAGNEGAGNIMGIGMGLGVGTSVGQMVGNTMQQMPQMAPQSVAFYVAKNGQSTGPYAIDIIKSMIQKGEITPDTHVYKVGGSAWTMAANAVEIAQFFSLMPPPPPPADAK